METIHGSNSTEWVDILPGLLREYNNTKHSSFYEQEMLKVELPQDSLFRIEKIIRRDNKLGRALVKWSGYPDIILKIESVHMQKKKKDG